MHFQFTTRLTFYLRMSKTRTHRHTKRTRTLRSQVMYQTFCKTSHSKEDTKVVTLRKLNSGRCILSSQSTHVRGARKHSKHRVLLLVICIGAKSITVQNMTWPVKETQRGGNDTKTEEQPIPKRRSTSALLRVVKRSRCLMTALLFISRNFTLTKMCMARDVHYALRVLIKSISRYIIYISTMRPSMKKVTSNR